MLKPSQLKGIIPAMVTPFTPDDELDVKGIRRLVQYLISNRVHGIMTTGGNGEFPHLTADERKKVLQTVVEEANGKVPVIACTTACSTRETIMLTKHAKDAGADASIVVQPYYFPLPDKALHDYYKSVAEAVDLPLVVYNNPGYTKNNISPALMAQIAKVDGVIGLKQSNYDISQTTEIIRLVGNKISVLTGIDSQLYATMCIGARGVFSTAACAIPAQMVELYEAFLKGDHKKAYDLQIKLHVLNRFFEYDPGYVAPCKEALMAMGLPGGHSRKPLPPLTDEEKRQIRAALKTLGLLKK